jgi:hypothetical protein
MVAAEAPFLLPGARIAPATSTQTCCQTLSENGGANRVNTCIIVVGRGYALDHLFLGDCGDERTLPLLPRMAKVQLSAQPFSPRFNMPFSPRLQSLHISWMLSSVLLPPSRTGMM